MSDKAVWEMFNGSQDHIDRMNNAPNGFIYINHNGKESEILRNVPLTHDINYFLICKPVPHGQMISRWALTGQPLLSRSIVYENENYQESIKPTWDIKRDYIFHSPEKTKCRGYLIRTNYGGIRCKAWNKGDPMPDKLNNFIQWIGEEKEISVIHDPRLKGTKK